MKMNLVRRDELAGDALLSDGWPGAWWSVRQDNMLLLSERGFCVLKSNLSELATEKQTLFRPKIHSNLNSTFWYLFMDVFQGCRFCCIDSVPRLRDPILPTYCYSAQTFDAISHDLRSHGIIKIRFNYGPIKLGSTMSPSN